MRPDGPLERDRPPYQIKGDLLKAFSGRILARVDLVGRYKRK